HQTYVLWLNRCVSKAPQKKRCGGSLRGGSRWHKRRRAVHASFQDAHDGRLSESVSVRSTKPGGAQCPRRAQPANPGVRRNRDAHPGYHFATVLAKVSHLFRVTIRSIQHSKRYTEIEKVSDWILVSFAWEFLGLQSARIFER